MPRSTVQWRVQISGNASAGLAYDMAIAQKSNQSTREQGRQALELIQSAVAPAPVSNGGVGSRLNVVA